MKSLKFAVNSVASTHFDPTFPLKFYVLIEKFEMLKNDSIKFFGFITKFMIS